MPLSAGVREGLIHVQQVNPAELAPGESGSQVRHAVEHDDVKVAVIDSLIGYLDAMPEERFSRSTSTSCSRTWASGASPRSS